jgi:hypothetical protein
MRIYTINNKSREMARRLRQMSKRTIKRLFWSGNMVISKTMLQGVLVDA